MVSFLWDGPTRIAGLWGISKRTVREFKSKLYDNPLSLFHYNVIDHRGKGMYQCVFCGESGVEDFFAQVLAGSTAVAADD